MGTGTFKKGADKNETSVWKTSGFRRYQSIERGI
jgi:hypothetical protein